MISNNIDGSSGSSSQLFDLLSLISNPDAYSKKLKELNDFSVYEIENSEIVEPVKQLVFKKKDKNWLETSTNWYLHQDLNQKIVFYQNEKDKQEIISNLNNVFIDKDLNNNEIIINSEIQTPKILSVEKDKISFEVEELGIPYIVKISYFYISTQTTI